MIRLRPYKPSDAWELLKWWDGRTEEEFVKWSAGAFTYPLTIEQLDAYFETGLKPWDVAAGILLVSEAGGRVSRSDGAPFAFGDEILASNGHVHEAMRRLLQEAAASVRERGA